MPDDTELRRAVKTMTAALLAGEWAEHVSADPDAAALECAITALIGRAAHAALLVRDIAKDLGVSALDVCNALRLMGYGQHSVNMAITPDAAGALTRHFGAATQPA